MTWRNASLADIEAIPSTWDREMARREWLGLPLIQIGVPRMREILAKLPDDALLMPNRVHNLSIIIAGRFAGWIDMRPDFLVRSVREEHDPLPAWADE